MQGIVKYINDDRGFGFLMAEDGQDYYFNVKAILDASIWPEKGHRVSFDLGSNRQGACAINVKVVCPSLSR